MHEEVSIQRIVKVSGRKFFCDQALKCSVCAFFDMVSNLKSV